MIRATITYGCGGCHEEFTTEPISIRARTESAFGGPIVKVIVKPKLDAEEHAPEGWVVYDPYTLVTYCPTCWDDVENGADDA